MALHFFLSPACNQVATCFHAMDMCHAHHKTVGRTALNFLTCSYSCSFASRMPMHRNVMYTLLTPLYRLLPLPMPGTRRPGMMCELAGEEGAPGACGVAIPREEPCSAARASAASPASADQGELCLVLLAALTGHSCLRLPTEQIQGIKQQSRLLSYGAQTLIIGCLHMLWKALAKCSPAAATL